MYLFTMNRLHMYGYDLQINVNKTKSHQKNKNSKCEMRKIVSFCTFLLTCIIARIMMGSSLDLLGLL